jgi:nucleoside-diphosphate-sugar epimerase
MRFLITGASGFVGSALVEQLAQRYGASALQLVVAPLATHAIEARRLALLERQGFELLRWDLLTGQAPHTLIEQLRPFDVLLHLAAYTHSERVDARLAVNDRGTRRLIDALGERLRGCHVVHTSSLAAVDRARHGDAPLREDDACCPRTAYGQSKLAGERVLRELADLHGYALSIVRLPTVYGPGYRPGGMFDLIARGLDERALAVRLNWPGRITLVNVRDVAATLIELSTARPTRDVTLHMAGVAPTFDEIISAVAEARGVSRSKVTLPRAFWRLARHAAWLPWLPGLPRLPSSRPTVALWRISLLVCDGMVADGTKLRAAISLQETGLADGLRQTYAVAERAPHSQHAAPSVSIIVPCRNERGNVASALERIPQLGSATEIIFVEGHSQDGTLAECRRQQQLHPERDIRVLVQDGIGKHDAVARGMRLAKGEVLMILDADLTTPPEHLPEFYQALVSGDAGLVVGSRFARPMEERAMPQANRLANRFFAALVSSIVEQPIEDALCGTKALWRDDFERIDVTPRPYRARDPFGDFELLFGAAQLGLRIRTLPVSYRSRVYGESQISRVRNGLSLLRIALQAWRARRVLRSRPAD